MSTPELPRPELIIPDNTPPDALNRIAEFRQNILASPSTYHEAAMEMVEEAVIPIGKTALREVVDAESAETLLPAPKHKTAKKTPSGVEIARADIEGVLDNGMGRYLNLDDRTEDVVDNDHEHEALRRKILEARGIKGNALTGERERKLVTAIHASRIKIFTRELMLTNLTNPAAQNQLAE